MKRLMTIAVVALIAVVGCASCTSDTPRADDGSRTTGPPSVPTLSSTGSTSPTQLSSAPTTTRSHTASKTTGGGTSVHADRKPCPISALAVHDAGTNQQRAGMAYGTIVARNTTSTTCTITGYPGMQLLAGAGATAPTRLTRAAGIVPHPVTLAPGMVASFGFSHRAYGPGGHCDEITGARIYDPDGSGYTITSTAFNECEGIRATGPLPVPVVVGPFIGGAHASIA